jgi:hypothetical protein
MAATAAPIRLKEPIQPWEITAGDDLVVTFRLKDTPTTYTDFTTWQFSVEVRDTATLDVKATLTIGDGIEIQDYYDEDDVLVQENGEVVIVIPTTATEFLRRPKSSLSFDLQTVNDSGITRTFLPSIITANPDSTRT